MGGLHGAADVGVAGGDVEGHAKRAKDHEGRVEREVGKGAE